MQQMLLLADDGDDQRPPMPGFRAMNSSLKRCNSSGPFADCSCWSRVHEPATGAAGTEQPSVLVPSWSSAKIRKLGAANRAPHRQERPSKHKSVRHACNSSESAVSTPEAFTFGSLDLLGLQAPSHQDPGPKSPPEMELPGSLQFGSIIRWS